MHIFCDLMTFCHKNKTKTKQKRMKEKAGTAPAIVCAMYYKLPLYLSLTLICTKCKDHFKTKKLAVIDPDTWKLEPWP